MKHYLHYILLFCLVALQINAMDTLKARDSLSRRLSLRLSYNDRVKSLFNLIDLASNNQIAFSFNTELLKISREKKDEPIQLEAIRNLASLDQDRLPYYIALVKHLKPTDKQKEMVVFLQYSPTLNMLSNKSGKERLAFVEDLIKRYKTEPLGDIYHQIGQLFCLCSILSRMTGGQLCVAYLKELGCKVDQLPSDGSYLLSNSYYVLAAQFYSHLDMQQEALAADRKILQMAPVLEARFRAQGRIYKNMDVYRCISYRRMLMYTHVLSLKEIESIFNEIKTLASKYKEIKDDLYNPCSISMIRYYMATKQYSKALPYVNNVLTTKDKKFAWLYNECLRYRIVIGNALRRDKDYRKYSIEYIAFLEDSYKKDLDVKSKELQLSYDVNRLIQKVSNLQDEKQKSEFERNKIITWISIISLLVIFVLLLIVLRYLHLYKISNSHLRKTSDKLREAYGKAEISDKMKTMFIRNMNHEIRTPLNAIVGFSSVLADENSALTNEERKHLSKIIEENSDILQRQLSELLDISLIEAGTIKCVYAYCDINSLCSSVVDKMRMQCQRGVSMQFIPFPDNLKIKTDERLISQVLTSLFDNACKFTSQGRIELAGIVNRKTNTVTFSVTDTGIGIPGGKKNVIFRAFEKLDTFKSGVGLGLKLCSSIAETLNGTVVLDSSYKEGARFLFTIPISGDIKETY